MTSTSPPIPRARLRHLARRIHRLGERPLYELFVELDAGADLEERLERYGRLDPDFIKAFGGDALPASARLITSWGSPDA